MSTPQENDTQILAMVQQFVDVANRLQEEGNSPEMVNASLMLASGTYSTFLAAGNQGYLKEAGIRKVTEAYRINLEKLQEIKKAQFNPDGTD